MAKGNVLVIQNTLGNKLNTRVAQKKNKLQHKKIHTKTQIGPLTDNFVKESWNIILSFPIIYLLKMQVIMKLLLYNQKSHLTGKLACLVSFYRKWINNKYGETVLYYLFVERLDSLLNSS